MRASRNGSFNWRLIYDVQSAPLRLLAVKKAIPRNSKEVEGKDKKNCFVDVVKLEECVGF